MDIDLNKTPFAYNSGMRQLCSTINLLHWQIIEVEDSDNSYTQFMSVQMENDLKQLCAIFRNFNMCIIDVDNEWRKEYDQTVRICKELEES